jgi:hypothetical protein
MPSVQLSCSSRTPSPISSPFYPSPGSGV